MTNPIEPEKNCSLCPRLVDFRQDNQKKFPDFFNGPVPAFGPLDATLLVVGLAPGLKGANWSGRPFTGDYAGDLLYPTLTKFGLADGTYGASADDGLTLTQCRITNTVRCVPPANKPVGAEINICREFLKAEIAAMKKLKVIIALGTVAHAAVLRVQGQKQGDYKFAHNARHHLPSGHVLIDSYHCSRYNTNTGRLTEAMFHTVFEEATALLQT